MPIIKRVRKTYKYRLYENDKRNRHLVNQIDIAGIIWNHSLALQKRYYRLTGKYIHVNRLQSHIAKQIRTREKFAFWRKVGSQAIQDIVARLDNAYRRFFDKKGGFPRFKKVKKYKSFTLKETAGWKLLPDKREPRAKATGNGYHRGIGVVIIQKRVYKYIKHRPLKGKIQTVTIKRDTLGRLWICFSVFENIEIPEVSTSRIGGFDFGLSVFLTDHTGKKYANPEYLKQDLPRIRSLNRSLSRKKKGSNNRRKTRYLLARGHVRIDDKRRHFHYEQAHHLCKHYDVLVFEDLNIDGMKRLWGRKVSDLAFSQFLEIVQWVAEKQGKEVILINRFEATTQTCSNCGNKQKLELSERVYDCPHCDLVLDRDHNAALNIFCIGASMHTARGD